MFLLTLTGRQWRFPLGFQLVFNIILYLTVPWLPESPRWLVGKDRHTEALQIIAALEAKPIDDVIVQTQLREIDESVKYELQNMIRWRDLFRGKVTGNTKTIRRLLLGAGTQLMQQFEGINIMSVQSLNPSPSAIANERQVLLSSNCAHRVRRPVQRASSPAHRGQRNDIPHRVLRLHPVRREMGSSKLDAALHRWSRVLLHDCHHLPPLLKRHERRTALRHRIHSILLLILHLFRCGHARSAVALPDGDQFFADEDERKCYCYGNKLVWHFHLEQYMVSY